MKNLNLVNVNHLDNTQLALQFVNFMPQLYNNWIDVYYSGKRIAIINGFESALQWTAKNGSNIPLPVIEYLEMYCCNNLNLA